MEENKNCIIIQHFLGEIYHNEIHDYELYKALIRILEAMQSKMQSKKPTYKHIICKFYKCIV